MLVLRPNDVAVALQLVLTPDAQFRALAASLHLSPGEVHKAVQRLTFARLVRPGSRVVNRMALERFLVAGVPYAFPANPGEEVRGVPTAHAGPDLAAEFGEMDPAVWPSAKGTRRGAALEPLYPGAPELADENRALYALLTLVDVLRIGRARERQRARQILHERLTIRPSSAS
jgi:hypothetical protein